MGEFSAQLDTFKMNIGSYAILIGVVAGTVTAQAADAPCFSYTLDCPEAVQNAAQQWTSWKKLIRAGGTPPAVGMPMAPVFPAAVPAVAPGVESRFRALVKQLKAHPNYSAAIGEALGIEGAEQSGPDLSTPKPVNDAAVMGSQVEIDWSWQGQRAFLSSCLLQGDRGDAQGWRLLTIDTTPGYLDTQTFPATPTRWRYRAIYRVGDGQVGQWSQEAEVVVG